MCLTLEGPRICKPREDLSAFFIIIISVFLTACGKCGSPRPYPANSLSSNSWERESDWFSLCQVFFHGLGKSSLGTTTPVGSVLTTWKVSGAPVRE